MWFVLLFACADRLLVQKGDRTEGQNREECLDGIDNDEDGYIDCDDQDCLIYDECSSNDDTGAIPQDTAQEDDTAAENDTGEEPSDIDGDGFTTEQGDCDDTNPAIFPGATEIPDDGIDQDCDGGDAQTTTQEDFDSPGAHTFIVPSSVQTITVGLWGAGGAGGEQLLATGGGGGYVEVQLSVTPSESLNIYVGEGPSSTGAGGGASAVFRSADLLAIAGGGGGGASDGNSGNSWAGGAGGAGGSVAEDGTDLLYHQQGTSYSYCTAATGGTGATQSAPGIGGVPNGNAEYMGVSSLCYGSAGASLEGGGATGENSNCNFNGPYLWETFSSGGANGHPGQGGAGYYGGGGGGAVYTYCGAGGGGGSSWASSTVLSVTYLDGAGQIQGNEAQSNGAGRGGERDYNSASDNGADGRVLISW